MNASKIRRCFVDYYKGLGFHPLPRAPMLHPSIPMSYVMSAGLVQVETSLARAEERQGDQFVLVQECFRILRKNDDCALSSPPIALLKKGATFPEVERRESQEA